MEDDVVIMGAGLILLFLLQILGLEGAADTPIGGQMARGVSGGQRKRVTIGERALLSGLVGECLVLGFR